MKAETKQFRNGALVTHPQRGSGVVKYAGQTISYVWFPALNASLACWNRDLVEVVDA